MVWRNNLNNAFRRFLWNRKTLLALLFVSPAILTAVGSFFMSRGLDGDIARLTREREQIVEFSRQLDLFTREVERYQLDRASLLLVLTAQNSDANLRYVMDRLFRLNAQSSMRRVVATLYPSDWADRMRRQEELVQADYGDKAAVDELQAFESAMIADAGKAITAAQDSSNRLADEIDDKAAWRSTIVWVGAYLLQLWTILLFFLKLNVN
jgi:hypothetical protein